jgi:hypothetical protein
MRPRMALPNPLASFVMAASFDHSIVLTVTKGTRTDDMLTPDRR